MQFLLPACGFLVHLMKVKTMKLRQIIYNDDQYVISLKESVNPYDIPFVNLAFTDKDAFDVAYKAINMAAKNGMLDAEIKSWLLETTPTELINFELTYKDTRQGVQVVFKIDCNPSKINISMR